MTSDDSTYTPLPQRAAKHALGLLLIVLVACIWVAASQLIQAIFADASFDKPYFLTYFNTCGFSLWLLGALCSPRWRRQLSRTHVVVALKLCPAWMLANYLFNLSLDYASVASNSVLSTTSNLWTMLFSACILGEQIDPVKLVAVAATVSGAALVAASDAGSSCGSHCGWRGDALALVSACVYGAYSVLIKARVPEGEDGLAMPLVFGCLGLCVLTLGWPLLLVLDAAHWEKLEWPSGHALALLTVNALVGTNLSDVLWARALQLTSPLIATLGLSLSIPFGMVSDMMLKGKTFGLRYVGGAGLVFTGFVFGSVAEHLWSKLWGHSRPRRCERVDGQQDGASAE